MKRQIRERAEVWKELSIAGFRGPLFLLSFVFGAVVALLDGDIPWVLAFLTLTAAVAWLLWLSVSRKRDWGSGRRCYRTWRCAWDVPFCTAWGGTRRYMMKA